MGDVFMRGDTAMMARLKEPRATAEARSGGWLNAGDPGIMHPDGFVELKDRAKDIIIWSGWNMADYTLPRTVVFGPLPKCPTGKVQKYSLRERTAQLDTPAGA